MKILEKRCVSKSNVKSLIKVPGLRFWTLLFENVYDDESSDVDVALITKSGIVLLVFKSPALGIGIDSLECRLAAELLALVLLLGLIVPGFDILGFILELIDLWCRFIVGNIIEESSEFLTGVEDVLLAGEFELLLRA